MLQPMRIVLFYCWKPSATHIAHVWGLGKVARSRRSFLSCTIERKMSCRNMAFKRIRIVKFYTTYLTL